MRQYQEPKGITQSNTLLTARMGWLSQSAGKPAKEKVMAKLNLNFHQQTGHYEPTKQEIYALEGIALSVEAIIKAMGEYCDKDNSENAHEALGVCMSICNTLELLIEPIVDYMGNYAGNRAAPEIITPMEVSTNEHI